MILSTTSDIVWRLCVDSRSAKAESSTTTARGIETVSAVRTVNASSAANVSRP